MRTKAFNMNNDEVIPFSNFVLDSYTNDRAAFYMYSPFYDEDHLKDVTDFRDVVDKIINPKSLTVQMKGATNALYGQFKLGLVYIDEIERYCEMAGKKLPLTKKDLEFSATRTKCHGKDAEGAIKGFKTMKDLLAPYLTVLEPLGYTKAKQESLNKLIKDINDSNTLQNSCMNKRAGLVQDNIGLVNQLWEKINDILKTGKTIYKQNPAKLKEYTQAKIVARIRTERDKDGEKDKKK